MSAVTPAVRRLAELAARGELDWDRWEHRREYFRAWAAAGGRVLAAEIEAVRRELAGREVAS